MVVFDEIDDGIEANDNLAMFVFQLKLFNGIFGPVACAGFVVTNVDDPAFSEVDVCIMIDPV